MRGAAAAIVMLIIHDCCAPVRCALTARPRAGERRPRQAGRSTAEPGVLVLFCQSEEELQCYRAYFPHTPHGVHPRTNWFLHHPFFPPHK